jgi:hypothetical protein
MKIQKTSLKNIKNKAVRNKSKIANKKIYSGGVGDEPKWHGGDECSNRLHEIQHFSDYILEVDSRLAEVDDKDIYVLKLLSLLDEIDFFKNECEEYFKYYIEWENWKLDTELLKLEDELQSFIVRLLEKKEPLTQADRIKIKKTYKLAWPAKWVKNRIDYCSSIIKDIQMGKTVEKFRRDDDWIIKYWTKEDLPELNKRLENDQKEYDRIMSQVDPDIDPLEVLDTYDLKRNKKRVLKAIRNNRNKKIKLNKKYKDGTRRTAIGIINKWATKFNPEVFNLLPGQTFIELRSALSLNAPQIMEMMLQSEEYSQKIFDSEE